MLGSRLHLPHQRFDGVIESLLLLGSRKKVATTHKTKQTTCKYHIVWRPFSPPRVGVALNDHQPNIPKSQRPQHPHQSSSAQPSSEHAQCRLAFTVQPHRWYSDAPPLYFYGRIPLETLPPRTPNPNPTASTTTSVGRYAVATAL